MARPRKRPGNVPALQSGSKRALPLPDEPGRRKAGHSQDWPHRKPEKLWPLLLGIGLLSLAARCLYLWQIHGSAYLNLRIGDGAGYHLWAKQIESGDWLGHGVFYQAPLYPYLLALIYRLLDDSVGTVRLVQAFLGACSCVLLAAAGVRLFGRLGALAGVLLALYPPAIFLDGSIEKSALATLLVAALLALAAPAERMTVRRSMAAGAVLGLLALTRENALILLLPLALWIAFEAAPGPPRTRWLAVPAFLAGCALILLPVGLRNLAVGGEFHLTTAQFGPNFYIGNHAGAAGTYEELRVGHGNVAAERRDATELAERATGRRLTPGGVSDYWSNRAFEFIRSEPGQWLRLMARKTALTFNATELPDTESQDVYAEESWLLRVLQPYDFGLLLGLAAMGAVLTAGSWRRLWFLYAMLAAYALSVVLFYVFARYRFPIVPMLMLLAAGGLGPAFHLVKRRRFRSLAAPAAAAILAIAVAHLTFGDTRKYQAPHYLNIAIELSKDPAQADLAMSFYQRALDAAPGFATAQVGLGWVLARTGRNQEAIPYFRQALMSSPDFEEAHYDLGQSLAATGKWNEAAQEYTEALRLNPDDPNVHIAFGKALTVLNQPDLALKHFERGLAIQPKDVKGLVGSGEALTRLGRPGEALERFRLALEIDPEDAAAHNDLGWTLASQGDVAEALPQFEQAVALDPNYTNARQNLDQARTILARTRRR